MSGEPGEEGAGARVMEVEVGEGLGREHGIESKAGHEIRLVGETENGAEGVIGEGPPLAGERGHEALPTGAVDAELGGSLRKITEEADGRAVDEGVGEWNFSVKPGEAEALEVERAKKR